MSPHPAAAETNPVINSTLYIILHVYVAVNVWPVNPKLPHIHQHRILTWMRWIHLLFVNITGYARK